MDLLNFLRPVDGTGSGSEGSGSGAGSGSEGSGSGAGSGYGSGYGYGYGYGSEGYGYGSEGYGSSTGSGSEGYGSGAGSGYGYGYGSGYGSGAGSGYGYGISFLNKKKVYIIDRVQTIISSIKKDIATGFIINNDLSLSACYIVRNDYFFSHGDTLKKALKSLDEKTEQNLSVEKRIENFKAVFTNYNKKYKASKLYNWHFKLTGSCETGRNNFCKNHNIDLRRDMFNIYEFVELTKNAYGGEIIKLLL